MAHSSKEYMRVYMQNRRAEEKARREADSKRLWSGIKFHYHGEEYITKFKSNRRKGDTIIVTMDIEKVI